MLVNDSVGYKYSNKMKNYTRINLSVLRKKAEAQLSEMQSESDLQLTEFDLLKLNHELLVQQLELELQNDELMQANELLEQVTEKYSDLYNSAPMGYFTLTKEGEIVETNFYGSKLLGKKQADLRNSQFGFFVAEESKPIFNQLIEKIIVTKVNETCMVSLNLNRYSKKHIYITGHMTKNGSHCLIAATDITELIENETKIRQLEHLNSFFIDRELKMLELKKEINELLTKSGSEKRY